MVVFHTSVYVMCVIKNRLPWWAFVNLFPTAWWGESPWSPYLVCIDQYTGSACPEEFLKHANVAFPSRAWKFHPGGKGLFNNAVLNWCGVTSHSICICIYIYSLSPTVCLIIIIRFSSKKERQKAEYAHIYTNSNYIQKKVINKMTDRQI